MPSAPTLPATGPAPLSAGGTLPHRGLAEQVAAAHSPSVNAAATKLAQLEALARGMQRGKGGDVGKEGEELGEGRDQLVAGIAELRGLINAMTADIGAPQLKALKAAFYRTINAISPFYYQHNNVIFEYSKKRGEKRDVWNTCNITSTSMALEALGKTPTDYDKPDLLPQVAAYFSNELTNKAADKTSADLAGYRMPEVLAMAAVVEMLGRRQGSPKQVAAAAQKAFEWIPALSPLKILAERFGVLAVEHYHRQISELRVYGKTHHKAAGRQGAARKAGRGTSAAGLSEGSIEQKVPLEAYKRGVLAQVVPEIDAGRQVVIGQFNHFVRLQALDDEFVIKDDPGAPGGANLKITWEEARAMGLFNIWLVIG